MMLQGLSPQLVTINQTSNKSQKIAINGLTLFGTMVIWSPGVTAGKFVVRVSPEKDFAGAWSPVTELEINFASGGAANAVQKSNAVQVLSGFLEIEAVTPVVGGTAKFYLATDLPGITL